MDGKDVMIEARVRLLRSGAIDVEVIVPNGAVSAHDALIVGMLDIARDGHMKRMPAPVPVQS